MLNLLDNAARFTPEGGAVRLSAYVEEAVLTVAVEDSGPGFSPEALARAGRGFYTGDASRPREGHMGMGLTFARQTARRQGGTLALTTTGGGARAALTRPLLRRRRGKPRRLLVFFPVPRYHRGRTHPNTVRSAL